MNCKVFLKKRKIFQLVYCILLMQAATAQPFIIKGAWKLNFEDKKDFRNPNYIDSAWSNLAELKWSDDHKTTANRTLWVRKKIVIPSSLQSEFAKTGLLSLSMGKILQTDDTYLNGKLLGSTGSGDAYRNYIVTKDDILWDKENTIAIRVSHWGSFNISKVPTLMAAEPFVFFAYNASLKNGNAKAPVQNQKLEYQLAITNKSPKILDAQVTADFYNFQGQKIYNAQEKVLLQVGDNPIVFPYKSSKAFVKIVYTLSVSSFKYTKQWNAEYGFENILYEPSSPVVAYKAPQQYVPAELSKIKIKGWLGERLEANTDLRLHKVDEDAILAGFINRPGNHSWIGEHIGKF